MLISFFFGGFLPTWARCTLEAIIDDYTPETRQLNVVIDYHTVLGPHGHGEPICCHLLYSSCLKRVMDVYGDFLWLARTGNIVIESSEWYLVGDVGQKIN